jgi:hypothetical protein
MKRYAPRVANTASALVRAQSAFGDVVDQRTVAILAKADPQMSAKTPLHSLHIFQLVPFNGETMQEGEAFAGP